MSILFCGDPHGNWRQINEVVLDEKPTAIVLLGDMELRKPLEEEVERILEAGISVYWIYGNHDCNNEVYYNNLFKSKLSMNNLHGRVVEIDGIRISGLGGVFRKVIYHPYHNKFIEEAPFKSRLEYLSSLPREKMYAGSIPLKHRASIYPEDIIAMSQLYTDVLVTHEAPSCHPYGFKVIDNLAYEMGARQIFHGHHHEDYNATLSNGVSVTGVGLAAVCKIDKTLLASGYYSKNHESVSEPVVLKKWC